MKTNFLYPFWLIATFFLISCSSDLKFTLPEIEPLLAIQSFVDPDKDFELIVTMAKPLQGSYIQMDPGCQADLYENDTFFKSLKLDTLSFNESHNNKAFLRFTSDSDLVFAEGNEYKVNVKHPGFEPVTSKTIKPDAVKIKEISSRKFTGEMPDWYYDTPWKFHIYDYSIKRDTSLIEFIITFDDPYETSDYYRIGINLITGTNFLDFFDRRLQYASYADPDPCFMKYNYQTEHPIYSGWFNPTVYEILWNDNNFNGEEHTIKILVPGSAGITSRGKYIISLYSLSEDYYKYMVDRWKYYKTEDDPFCEPVKFHSNTSNDCGIFAISSLDVDTIQF